jgi:hypothetical protein
MRVRTLLRLLIIFASLLACAYEGILNSILITMGLVFPKVLQYSISFCFGSIAIILWNLTSKVNEVK